jgi:predicted ATP-grasp superfamily ATP-dependent carboligase
MRVFLYEFVTGGGFLDAPGGFEPTGSLLDEGAAMLRALASDFAALPQVAVHLLVDAHCTRLLSSLSTPRGPATFHFRSVATPGERDQALYEEAERADVTLVIAPELDNHLGRLIESLRKSSPLLLAPGTKTLAWASHKQRTAEQLVAAGVRCPLGIELAAADWRSALDRVQTPLVIKPVDGCGSLDIRLLTSVEPQELRVMDAQLQGDPTRHYRFEPFIPGQPASVALLCGPAGPQVLRPCWQRLSQDGTFTYLGGGVLQRQTHPAAIERLERLAHQVAALLQEDLGYVGIDCILAESPDDDHVIEVNPRLTTSYVGLRRAARTNLAAAMWQVALGNPQALVWSDEMIRFDAHGTL